MTSSSPPGTSGVPAEPLGRLFLRFLKFGALAWGGPVAQIAMVRQEIVEEERWISRERFNRLLAVYQVLPGPEAHELCVYFGMLSRGRIGGTLAGLGFMLPGFLLMFLLSALYVGGLQSPLFQTFFFGIQPAVVALIVRAVHRIGEHILTNRWLWGVALVAALAQLVDTSFWVTLPLSGIAYASLSTRRYALVAASAVLFLTGVLLFSRVTVTPDGVEIRRPVGPESVSQSGGTARGEEGTATFRATGQEVSLPRLFVSGLRAGLLTFGGAYTVLPFLQHDAVEVGKWVTNSQFLDGVALSGILPAPFIIFSTFVGYLGGGATGALVLTVGIFLPAFSFSLVGHRYLERLVENVRIRTFLDGVTAGVFGLIAAIALTLFRVGVRDAVTAVIFGLALLGLYRWKSKAVVPIVILSAGAVGAVLFR